MGNAVNRIKTAILKIVNVFKYIWGFIKGLLSPIGTVLAWILMFIFIIIILQVVFMLGEVGLKEIFGTYTIGSHEADMRVLNELSDTGYATFLDSRNLQDYADFEYAMLMDVAKFLMSGEGVVSEKISGLQTVNKTMKKVENESELPKIELLSSTGKGYQVNNIGEFYSHYKAKYSGDSAIDSNMNITNYTRNMYKIVNNEAGKAWSEDASKGPGDPFKQVSTIYGSDKVHDLYVLFEFKYKVLEDGTYSEKEGALIPYLYVPRDEVDYEFLLGTRTNVSGDNILVTMPQILNIYNNNLNKFNHEEWSRKMNNTYEDRKVAILPDEGYQRTPFYADESKTTMYKIPLETLIGRYMSKVELLETWTVAKKEIVDENDPVYKIASNIQKLYIHNATEKNKYSSKEVDGKKYLVEADNDKQTFLEFGQIGLETTRFTEIEVAKDDLSGKVTYVINFVSALKLNQSAIDKLTIPATPTTTTPEQSTETDGTTEVVEDKASIEDINAALSDAGITYSSCVFAEESEISAGKYYPPSELKEENAYIIRGKKKEDIGIVAASVNKALLERTGNPNITVSESDFIYAPIFITESANVQRMVRAINKRIPALFVTSAKTWARNIKYKYTIEQNIFNPDDERYVLPENTYFTGLTKLLIEQEKNEYRTEAYEDLFKNIQEKDVVTSILQLEEYADDMPEAYEYMRDLYKLVKATQDYSVNKR